MPAFQVAPNYAVEGASQTYGSTRDALRDEWMTRMKAYVSLAEQASRLEQHNPHAAQHHRRMAWGMIPHWQRGKDRYGGEYVGSPSYGIPGIEKSRAYVSPENFPKQRQEEPPAQQRQATQPGASYSGPPMAGHTPPQRGSLQTMKQYPIRQPQAQPAQQGMPYGGPPSKYYAPAPPPSRGVMQMMQGYPMVPIQIPQRLEKPFYEIPRGG